MCLEAIEWLNSLATADRSLCEISFGTGLSHHWGCKGEGDPGGMRRSSEEP